MTENSMKHYREYAKAHRRFQALPDDVKRKYSKFVKAGIGLVEFMKLHDEGKLDKMTVIIVEKETEKETIIEKKVEKEVVVKKVEMKSE